MNHLQTLGMVVFVALCSALSIGAQTWFYEVLSSSRVMGGAAATTRVAQPLPMVIPREAARATR
ncbi:MAG: hypothetical protein ABI794_15985 [Betaproteobacteria bacterium]